MNKETRDALPLNTTPDTPSTTVSVESLHDTLVFAGYHTSSTYTERGGTELLEERLEAAVQKLLSKMPDEGVITIKKLSDGGYSVTTHIK